MEHKVFIVSYCNCTCTLEHVGVKIQINEKVGLCHLRSLFLLSINSQAYFTNGISS